MPSACLSHHTHTHTHTDIYSKEISKKWMVITRPQWTPQLCTSQNYASHCKTQLPADLWRYDVWPLLLWRYITLSHKPYQNVTKNATSALTALLAPSGHRQAQWCQQNVRNAMRRTVRRIMFICWTAVRVLNNSPVCCVYNRHTIDVLLYSQAATRNMPVS